MLKWAARYLQKKHAGHAHRLILNYLYQSNTQQHKCAAVNLNSLALIILLLTAALVCHLFGSFQVAAHCQLVRIVCQPLTMRRPLTQIVQTMVLFLLLIVSVAQHPFLFLLIVLLLPLLWLLPQSQLLIITHSCILTFLIGLHRISLAIIAPKAMLLLTLSIATAHSPAI